MEISRVTSSEMRRVKGVGDQSNTQEQLRNAKARQQKEKAAQKLPETAAAEPRSGSGSSAPTSGGRMGKIFQVIVNGIRGEKVMIDLCNTDEQMRSMTVRQLKEKILQRLPHITTYENLRLIFVEKELEDDSLLSEYGIEHHSVIHTIIKVAGGGYDPARGDGGIGD